MTVNMEKKGSGQHTPTKLVWVHLEDGSVSDVIPEPFFIGNPVLSDVCLGYGQDFLPWGEWHKMPFKVQTPEGVFDLTIRNLQVDVFFPWPRTFEVYLDVRLNLYRLNN